MKYDNTILAFFELVRAGLWEQDIRLSFFKEIDFSEVLRIAEEQTVEGLVAAGLERLDAICKKEDVKNCIPKEQLMTFIGQVLFLEQQNVAMNEFVAKLLEKLRRGDVYALLVKGLGIAQCYERPLWRTPGDVDLLLNGDDYQKAKTMLEPLATNLDSEYTHFKHMGMVIEGWTVELHGTLHTRLSKHLDRVIDKVQHDVFYRGNVRTWQNGNTQLFLPAPNEDVIFVFTHILHHFFFEGIGLRQICDWCRLLWTYRDSIDVSLLESRIKKMGLMTEWKTFAAYVVEWLGMPVEAMPIYSANLKWKRKARHINDFVLEVGNFGYNHRRNYEGMPYLKRKFFSFWGRLSDMLRHISIFPKDSIMFFGGILRSGLYAALHGE